MGINIPVHMSPGASLVSLTLLLVTIGTVELWKRGGLFIYSLFRVKPKPPAVINSPTSAAEGEQPSDEAVTVNGELEEEGGREDLRHSNESTVGA